MFSSRESPGGRQNGEDLRSVSRGSSEAVSGGEVGGGEIGGARWGRGWGGGDRGEVRWGDGRW